MSERSEGVYELGDVEDEEEVCVGVFDVPLAFFCSLE